LRSTGRGRATVGRRAWCERASHKQKKKTTQKRNEKRSWGGEGRSGGRDKKGAPCGRTQTFPIIQGGGDYQPKKTQPVAVKNFDRKKGRGQKRTRKERMGGGQKGERKNGRYT